MLDLLTNRYNLLWLTVIFLSILAWYTTTGWIPQKIREYCFIRISSLPIYKHYWGVISSHETGATQSGISPHILKCVGYTQRWQCSCTLLSNVAIKLSCSGMYFWMLQKFVEFHKVIFRNVAIYSPLVTELYASNYSSGEHLYVHSVSEVFHSISASIVMCLKASSRDLFNCLKLVKVIFPLK
jgi:hypothetical protein